MRNRPRIVLRYAPIVVGALAGWVSSCGGADEPADGPALSPDLASVPHHFTDATEEAGLEFTHTAGFTDRYFYVEIMGGGMSLFDYDGDGYLDVYFVNGNHVDQAPAPDITNVLYRNDGDGTFTDVTAAAGVGDPTYGQGCCCGDYDNDGDQDLFVTNFGPDRLYRNDGDGTFTDVTAASGIDNPLWGQSCSFLDYDRDGHLDLYVQNYLTYSVAEHRQATLFVAGEKVLDYPGPLDYPGAPDRLYHNAGDGTFTDVTVPSGIDQPNGRGMGLACADFDQDGDTDLFVSNDAMENYFFDNRGDGSFEDRSIVSGLAYDLAGSTESSMGVDVGDVDGDGRFDIVCPATASQSCTLYRNTGAYFRDVSLPAGIVKSTLGITGFSPNLLDADNDGDLDLFVSNGGVLASPDASFDAGYLARYGRPDLLLINDGTGCFDRAPESASSHLSRTLIGRGSAAGDLDNDGDLDLVISNLGGAAILLRNDGPQGNWVTLRLVSTGGNRDAIGATLEATVAGRTRVATIRGGGGYLSDSDRRAHFGLGGASRVERLEIVWPDGGRQTLLDLETNRIHVIRQSRD